MKGVLVERGGTRWSVWLWSIEQSARERLVACLLVLLDKFMLNVWRGSVEGAVAATSIGLSLDICSS